MHLFYDFLNEISNFEASLWWVFPKNWEPVINISWLRNEQVKVCFFTLESPYPYFCCNLRHNVIPYMYSEMQNKLSKTRDSPLESMGQIISSRCPESFHINLVQNGTMVSEKIWFDFLYVHDLGPKSRNDLDLQYSYTFMKSISCLYLPSFRSQASKASETSILFHFFL